MKAKDAAFRLCRDSSEKKSHVLCSDPAEDKFSAFRYGPVSGLKLWSPSVCSNLSFYFRG